MILKQDTPIPLTYNLLICIQTGKPGLTSFPALKAFLQAARCNLPLEVLGMVRGGTNTTWSGGKPKTADILSVISDIMASCAFLFVSAVSATMTKISVPHLGSSTPNATT